MIVVPAVLAACLLSPGAAQAAKAPRVNGEASFAVTQTTAIVQATINTGHAATGYRFQYVTQTEFEAAGYSAPSTLSTPEEAVEEGASVRVAQTLTGLEPATTYHYRVLVKNGQGEEEGEDQTFTTLPLLPPHAITGPASNVSQNTATLTATIDTQGVQSSYEFDIGPDTSYGTRIFANAGSTPGPQPFTVTLTGLLAGSTYHYRIIATNIYGTSYGTDEIFTTPAYPTAVLTAPIPLPYLPSPLITQAPLAPKANTAKAKPVARIARHARKHKNAHTTVKKRRKHRQANPSRITSGHATGKGRRP